MSSSPDGPRLFRSIAHRLAGEPLALPIEGHLASFAGATGWLNSEPLTPDGLRGRVVLVDFWTYTCVNWLRTLPYRPGLGGEVRGRRADDRRRAHARVRLRAQHRQRRRRSRAPSASGYPVALDSDYAVWRAFANHFWPAVYLADGEGRLRYHHFGEGEYAQTEMAIQQLLLDAGAQDLDLDLVDGRAARTRGGRRLADAPVARDVRRLRPEQRLRVSDDPRALRPAPRLRRSRAAAAQPLGARGELDGCAGTPRCRTSPAARIAFRFHARDVNLVMGPAAGGAVDPVPGLPRRPGRGRARTGATWPPTAAGPSATSARIS